MNIFTLIPFIAFLINGFVWTYIYAQKKNSPINNAFLLYGADVACWLIYAMILRSNIPENYIIPVMKYGSFFWISIVFWFFNFTYVYLDKKRNWYYYLTLALVIIYSSIAMFTDLVITGYQYEYWGIDENFGKLFFPIIVTGIFIPAAYSLYLIALELKKADNKEQFHSLLLIFIGSSVTLIIGLISNAIIPYYFGMQNVIQFAETATVIQAIFIFRAVDKYKLFSLNIEDVGLFLFEKMQDAVILTDRNNIIKHINPAARKIFNINNDESIGTDILSLLPFLSLEMTINQLESEITIGNEKKVISISMSSIIRENEENGKLIIINDITEKKKQLEMIRISREQLRALAENLQNTREEERTHIAREIHDELGQIITAVKMDMILFSESLNEKDPDRDQIQKDLVPLIELVDSLIEKVRNIATELRPDILDHLGLLAALEWQVNEFEKRTGIKCTFNTVDENPRLSKGRRTAVFRILQEALTNVIRHSQCTELSINLWYDNEDFIMQVVDNGRGITPEEIQNIRSIGITGMKERSHILGGELFISGETGKGTTLTLRVPSVRIAAPPPFTFERLNEYNNS